MSRVKEELVPAPQGDVAAALFEALTPTIAGRSLSFGGGTVLAARWDHRQSFDVDLFCDPNVYGRFSRRDREKLEDSICQIEGCEKNATWCEDIATYAVIGDIEATVLPRVVAIDPTEPTRLAGTDLMLQGTAQILYAKIVKRMYENGEIAVRDAYDLAAAAIHAPKSLSQARRHASPRVLETVSTIIKMLPDGWTRDDIKGLIAPLRHICDKVQDARDANDIRAEQAALGTGQRWGRRGPGTPAPFYIAENVNRAAAQTTRTTCNCCAPAATARRAARRWPNGWPRGHEREAAQRLVDSVIPLRAQKPNQRIPAWTRLTHDAHRLRLAQLAQRLEQLAHRQSHRAHRAP